MLIQFHILELLSVLSIFCIYFHFKNLLFKIFNLISISALITFEKWNLQCSKSNPHTSPVRILSQFDIQMQNSSFFQDIFFNLFTLIPQWQNYFNLFYQCYLEKKNVNIKLYTSFTLEN